MAKRVFLWLVAWPSVGVLALPCCSSVKSTETHVVNGPSSHNPADALSRTPLTLRIYVNDLLAIMTNRAQR